MNSIRIRCPAKINWSLRVLGRRPDGYHEIDTLYQAVDLWDEVEIEPAADLTLRCDDPDLPTDETNLVLRAAVLLRERSGKGPAGARLRLSKRIPSRAGIGSDVPFFLTGGTARGTGRGERIEPLPFVGPVPLLVGKPPFGISTADAYGHLQGRLTLPVKDVSLRRLATHKVPGGNDFGTAVNDLEQVVCVRWPELSAFRDALLARGASRALLSGSGSSVFGVFDSEESVDEAREGLRVDYAEWTLIASRAVRDAVHLAGGE